MKKQQQRSEETRTRLLQAAESCFAERGFDATGVATICRTAGVSKGAFYHHFSSKQEVFLELLTQWLAGLDVQLNLLRDGTASIPDGLLSMTGIFQEVLRTAEDQLPIYLEFWNRATHDPEILSVMVEPFHRYRAFFAKMIEEGIADGTLHTIDVDTAARLIISLAIGMLFQGLLEPMGAKWEEVTQESIKILLGGLLKR